MKSKLKKKILTFILIFNVLTLSFVPCVNSYKVEAAATTATVASIAGYILSVLGATDMLTDGGVRAVSGNVLDALKAKISQRIGDGIYVDSDGNYVFSNSVSSEIYNILNSELGTDVRVISNFGSNEPVLNASLISSELINQVASVQHSYSQQGGYASYWFQGQRNDLDYTYCMTIRSYQLAYIQVGNGSGLSFKDDNLQYANVGYELDYCYYSSRSGTFSQLYTDGGTASSFFMMPSNSSGYYCYPLLPHWTYNGNCYVSYQDNTFPGFGRFSLSSNHSLIIAKNSAAANACINQTSGVVYNNSSGTIPSIKESVINNNDWSKIYNNYVTNVQTQYTTSDKDLKKLRQAMKTYSDNIVNVINTGNDNILQQILDTNGWLTEIYDKIDQIYTYLTNMQSGGGGSDCPWTSAQITAMLDWLEDIEGNTADIAGIASDVSSIDSTTSDTYTQILAMKTLLQQILSALQNGGGGSGGTPLSPSYTIPNTKVPWDDLDDLTTDNITNYVTNTQIIQGLLEDTAIFAYAVVLGDIINGLATQPQVPEFIIPFEYDSSYTGAALDYDFDLDFDELHFENVHAILIAGECALFILYCAWLFLMLIKIVYDFLK